MLNNENYKEVLENEGNSIVVLSGDGCANCITMYSVVNEFVSKYQNVNMHLVEIDERYSNLLSDYEVDKIPAVLVFKKGVLLAKVSGYQPYEVFELYILDKLGL